MGQEESSLMGQNAQEGAAKEKGGGNPNPQLQLGLSRSEPAKLENKYGQFN